jgi:hypothetical protein
MGGLPFDNLSRRDVAFSAALAAAVTLTLALVPPAVSACSDAPPVYASASLPPDVPVVRLRTPLPQQPPHAEPAEQPEQAVTAGGIAGAAPAEGAAAPAAEPPAPTSPADAAPAATLLSDAECAARIIDYESRGDPWAENGRYKGIGQLDESYYPLYIGRTWAEVAGDYDAQFEAMSAYVMSRHGSWQAAWAHIEAKGWY